jgi:hypothetical protein
MIFYFVEYQINSEGQQEFDGVVGVMGDELYYKFKSKDKATFWHRIKEMATAHGPQLLRWHIENANDYTNIRSELKRSSEEDLKGFIDAEYARQIK